MGFHGEHPCAHLDQWPGQRPLARPQVEHELPGLDRCVSDDPPGRRARQPVPPPPRPRSPGTTHHRGAAHGQSFAPRRRRRKRLSATARARASPPRRHWRPHRDAVAAVRGRAVAPRGSRGEGLAVADREERVGATVHHERGHVELAEPLPPSRGAVDPGEHHPELVRLVHRGIARRRPVPDPGRRRPRLLRIVAQDLGALGGERRDGIPVRPVGQRVGEQRGHDRGVVVRQVLVDRARRHRPGADEGQCGEHVRVVERGDLSDHPTDADPTEMGGPGTEHPDQRGRVGDEIPQVVRRILRVEGRRRAGVTQVVADHAPPARREPLAQRVGPGQHRRAADQQDQRRPARRRARRLGRRRSPSSSSRFPFSCLVGRVGSGERRTTVSRVRRASRRDRL